ncbi:MAG: BA14K family protein [Xanthobacteraceae bacterium]|nr:BA14K family protein [Xanthobacteraceae bacterium]
MDQAAHCFSRYRSFDAISGTYLRRDGRRYYCR